MNTQTNPIPRRTFLRLAATGLAVLTLPSLLLADAEEDRAKALIQSIYDEWNAALKKRDLPAFERNHTSDYIYIDRKGTKRPLKHLIAEIRGLLPKLDAREAETKIESIKVKGETATVEMEEKAFLFLKREDGTSARVEVQTYGRDFWVRRNGKWLLKQSRTLEEKMLMDGREFSL